MSQCHSVTCDGGRRWRGERITDKCDSHCRPSDTVPALEIIIISTVVSLPLSLQAGTVVEPPHPGSHHQVRHSGGGERKTTEEEEGSHLHGLPPHIACQAGGLVGLTDRPQQAVGSLLLHTEKSEDPTQHSKE